MKVAPLKSLETKFSIHKTISKNKQSIKFGILLAVGIEKENAGQNNKRIVSASTILKYFP